MRAQVEARLANVALTVDIDANASLTSDPTAAVDISTKATAKAVTPISALPETANATVQATVATNGSSPRLSTPPAVANVSVSLGGQAGAGNVIVAVQSNESTGNGDSGVSTMITIQSPPSGNGGSGSGSSGALLVQGPATQSNAAITASGTGGQTLPAGAFLLPQPATFQASDSGFGSTITPLVRISSGTAVEPAVGTATTIDSGDDPDDAVAVPRLSGVLADAGANIEAVRQAMQQALAQAVNGDEGWQAWVIRLGISSALVAAAISAIAYDVARRRKNKRLRMGLAGRNVIPAWWFPELGDPRGE
jgi:hypothetical protein